MLMIMFIVLKYLIPGTVATRSIILSLNALKYKYARGSIVGQSDQSSDREHAVIKIVIMAATMSLVVIMLS